MELMTSLFTFNKQTNTLVGEASTVEGYIGGSALDGRPLYIKSAHTDTIVKFNQVRACYNNDNELTHWEYLSDASSKVPGMWLTIFNT